VKEGDRAVCTVTWLCDTGGTAHACPREVGGGAVSPAPVTIRGISQEPGQPQHTTAALR
jgi:hypothetical protein